MTLRSGLENSRNLVTARLLDGGIKKKPDESLKAVCALAKENHIYNDCIPLLSVRAGRAAGTRARPCDVLRDHRQRRHAAGAARGRSRWSATATCIYRRPKTPLVAIDSADKVAFFQLKSILQGVLSRGTGAASATWRSSSAARPAPARTETTPGSSASANDVTVAIWVGYDNAAARAARSAAAEPARASRFRSSSRSSRRAGSMSRRARRSLVRRLR